jgi:SOS response regulatory protein OraA/RecX
MADNNSQIRATIVQAIKNMLSQGQSYEQIKQYLMSKGYPESIIYQYYSEATQEQSKNKQQLIQITDYIRNMEARGYKFQQIKTFLIQKGYSSQLIDEAGAHLPQKEIHEQDKTVTHKYEYHLPGKTALFIIGIIVIIMIVGGGLFYFLNPLKETSTLLDLKVQAHNTNIKAGGALYFDVTVLSMSDARETFDMILTYNILDDDDELIIEEEETIAITTTMSHSKKINLPSDLKEGKYKLKILSNYNGRNAIASFEFNVGEAEQTLEEELPQEPIKKEELDEEEEPEINMPPEQEQETNNQQYSSVMERILRTSRNNPNTAVQACREQTDLNVDRCIQNIAIEFENAETCSKIENSQIKDDCYMALLLKGNIEVCNNIENLSLKNNCNTIRDIYLIEEYENSDANMEQIAQELGIEFETAEPGEDNGEIQVIDLEE